MIDAPDLPLVSPDDTVRDVMSIIDRYAAGIAVVVDPQQHLLGTLTDGDVRRALLTGCSLDNKAAEVLVGKTHYPGPVTASVHTDRATLVKLMKERKIRQIPLLDDQARVAGLTTIDDLLPNEALPCAAVIMAGGQGKRLLPLTSEMPKPMLPVGDRPLLERTIEQLRQAGIRRVHITTHYKGEMIAAHFGDGEAFGVKIEYVAEDQPLGTAGALGLANILKERTLVINGDILTRTDFRAMLEYHEDQGSDLTVAVCRYELKIPYGIVECEDLQVRRINEKPSLRLLANAGIYVLEPSVREYIPCGRRFEMTDLIERLVEEGRRVVSFPLVEYWLDVGYPEDYERAQMDLKGDRP